jgi:very-long-chain enoyl-CoA reductase
MELIIVDTNKSKDKREDKSVVCNLNNKVIELKNMIKTSLNLKSSTDRIGLYFNEPLTNKKIWLKNNKQLREYNVFDKMSIYFKDLGPQIDWRLTYIIEYLGPFFIIIFLFLYMGPSNTNTTQKLGFIMSTFHYGKRVLESIFVHEFSNNTMPLKNLFINTMYYWVLYGVICGYSLFNENYIEPDPKYFLRYFVAFLFFSAEIKNLKCHLILKKLKEANRGEKGIPHGEGFEYVSCANYFWEFVAWFCFSIFVNLIPFYIFTLCGFLIMRSWAIKRHKEYLETFPDRYPKNRKAFIPFVI